MSAPAWLAPPGATFEEALAVGGDVRAALLAAAPSLPHKDLGRLYPATMQDAVAVVHARLEENKKKAAASKQKSKSKGGAPHSPSDSHFPGARPGGGDPSAFWLYIEDYFRDFSQDDLRGLLPLLRNPRDDPAYRVPPSGKRVDSDPAARKAAATKAAAEAAAAKAAASRLGSEWDIGAVDSKPSAYVDPNSLDAERRSSRLVSRQCKEEEARRQQELEAAAAAAASAAEQAEAAAAAAAARAMAVVPTTVQGAPAKQLLDVLPEQRLGLLLAQLTDLLELTDQPPLPTGSCSEAAQAALAQLLAATAAGIKPEEMPAAIRDELELWLRRELAPLAERLGCSLPVLPPWAGQAAGEAAVGTGQEGQPAKQADGKQAAQQAGQQQQAAQQQQQQQPGGKATGGGRKKGKGAAAAAEAAADADAGLASPLVAAKVAAAAPAAAAAGEPPKGRLPTAAFLHPYTELMLRHPVQQHTVQQALEAPALDGHAGGLPRTTTMGQLESAGVGATAGVEGETAATPAASALTATPGTGGTLKAAPSVGNLSSLAQQQPAATASTAAVASAAGAAADTAGTAELLASPAAAAAADGAPLDGAADGAAAGQQQLGSVAASARTGGRARAVSNYALLAGKKQTNRNAMGPPKKVVRTQTVRPELEAAAQHPVARAVAAMVAAGEAEPPAAEQWQAVVEHNEDLLAAAPEDEVLAEMLALQNELMAQAAVNRARLVPALQGVVGELEQQKAAAEQRAAEEEEVKAWILKMRELKRQQVRQRREQAHQEALAAKKQSIMASPRPVLGRQRGAYQGTEASNGDANGRDGSPALEYALRSDELYDVLAQREADQEAFCAVCGDGHSAAHNQIVFCDRCDVAVHQQCYGIAVVPEGEWLCEPCREYEHVLRAQGVPESGIRPPGHAEAVNRQPLDGGARSVRCALCPIKYGAFKKAEDGQRWVHSACALWMPETFLSYREVPGVGRQEFVAGLEKVKHDRLEARCAICGLTDGAVMGCQQPGGCHTHFHVLCARNIGLYLTIRPDPSRKSAVQYRIYCALHSAAQQSRDEKIWQERLEKAAQQQQKESKAKQAERMAAAKAALTTAEQERHQMYMLRANLEMCRMLIDVTKRRERLKKQLAVLQQQEWPLLLAEPAAGLALLEESKREQQEKEAEEAAAAAAMQQGPLAGLGAGLGLAPAGSVAASLAAQLEAPQPVPPLPQFSLPLPTASQAAAPLPPAPSAAATAGLLPASMPGLTGGLPGSFPLLPSSMPGGMPGMGLPAMGGLPGGMQPALLPLAQSAPSFALDMFGDQPAPQPPPPAPAHFFMQQQMAAMQAAMQRGQPATSAAAAAAFAGLPLQLPGNTPASVLQHPPQPLPATAPGALMPAPGSNAVTAQVPADVAAAMMAAPSGLMPLQIPGQQPQQPFPAVNPAVLAAMQAQPAAKPAGGTAAAAAAAAAGDAADTPRGASPAVSTGSGRPKRAGAPVQPGSSKRQRRAGSEDMHGSTPRGGSAGGMLPPPPPQPPAPSPTGAAAAAGRRQRTASVKVRENLLQRERQMTAEEAEALNARLPGPLRYLPAAELEATLGAPGSRGGSRSSTPRHQQSKSRGRQPGK